MKGSWLIKIGMLLMTSSLILSGIKNTDKALKDFNNDYLLSRIIVHSTEESYSVFKDKVTKYKEDITEFYDSLDFYYDQFDEKHKEIKSHLEEVEEDYASLEEVSSKLYENCKYDIEDANQSEKCEAYKSNLINLVSSHSKLIDDYNDIINMYNEYASTYNKEKIAKYEGQSSDKLGDIKRELDK